MIRKTWEKQLHRRKIWKSYTLLDKTWYYMKPFVIHLIIVWLQPLPVPTIMKLIYSSGLLVFILFPVIYPGAIFLGGYWVVQYVLESDFGAEFPEKWDFRSYVNKVIDTDPTGEYRFAVYYYCERFKILVATAISLIDYLRLAMSAAFGV